MFFKSLVSLSVNETTNDCAEPQVIQPLTSNYQQPLVSQPIIPWQSVKLELLQTLCTVDESQCVLCAVLRLCDHVRNGQTRGFSCDTPEYSKEKLQIKFNTCC